MTDQILLTIPDDISARVRRIAESTEQPVEQVLLNYLKNIAEPLPTLAPAEQAELDALRHLSDDALWTIAREQMAQTLQDRAHMLLDKNSLGTITDDEVEELEQLVERGDRLMLRKAEAAALLKNRGHDFTQHDFKPHS